MVVEAPKHVQVEESCVKSDASLPETFRNERESPLGQPPSMFSSSVTGEHNEVGKSR